LAPDSKQDVGLETERFSDGAGRSVERLLH
jgi:hypothetical protein